MLSIAPILPVASLCSASSTTRFTPRSTASCRSFVSLAVSCRRGLPPSTPSSASSSPPDSISISMSFSALCVCVCMSASCLRMWIAACSRTEPAWGSRALSLLSSHAVSLRLVAICMLESIVTCMSVLVLCIRMCKCKSAFCSPAFASDPIPLISSSCSSSFPAVCPTCHPALARF